MRRIHPAFIALLLGSLFLGCRGRKLETNPLARAAREQAVLEQSVRQAFAPVLDHANTKLAGMADTVFTQVDVFKRATVFVREPPAPNPELALTDPIVVLTGTTLAVIVPDGAEIATWTDKVLLVHRLDAQYRLESVRLFRRESLAEPYAARIQLRATGKYWSALRAEQGQIPSPPDGMMYWPVKDGVLGAVMYGRGSRHEEIRPLPVPDLGTPTGSADRLLAELRRDMKRCDPVEIDDPITVHVVYSVDQGRWIESEDRPDRSAFDQIKQLRWPMGLPDGKGLPIFRPEHLKHDEANQRAGSEDD